MIAFGGIQMRQSKKASPKLVKLLNRELIINELKQNPKQSRADLSKATNLSKPAVSVIVKELIEEGLVFETGVGPSNGGKKPILLEYNSKSNYVIGTLIQDDNIFIGLGDMNGELEKVIRTKFKPPIDGLEIVDMIANEVLNLLSSENIDPSLIKGMTIGVSGITEDERNVISSSPNVNWKEIHLKDELTQRLNFNIAVENDVNLMTIGEFHKGQGKEINNFVYLYIGNGIGSGLFLNGSFYKGFHSAAGEIGYMMIGKKELAKDNLGVFEANYGRSGIKDRLEAIQFPFVNRDSIIQELQLCKNHEVINNILQDIITEWAKATVNIISVIDPEVVILSGELTYLDEESYQHYINLVEQFVPKMPVIKQTELGSKAGLYGAIHLALDQFHVAGFKHIFEN